MSLVRVQLEEPNLSLEMLKEISGTIRYASIKKSPMKVGLFLFRFAEHAFGGLG